MTQGLRLALNALLILGVFAMHHLLLSVSDGVQPHHDVESTSQVVAGAVHASASVVAETATAARDSVVHSALVACGDLAALCLAIMLGVSAFMMLRRRGSGGVLWQLPRSAPAGPRPALRPVNALSPLQRTSILRC